ncbi:fumarylacetoacetate hydrolase family protein [Sphingopyxis kveilinensis]|uniref:fumarylacetoacetate hydrolase family protein n=1 Tax=Sphingopyxis kveilinensis TaxID=3114367 RepID=UPI0030D1212B
MRLVSYRIDGRSRSGVRIGERVYDLDDLGAGDRSLIALLADGGEALGALARKADDADVTSARALAELDLLPAVAEPGKIICLGLNYVDHAREGNLPIPEHPVVFLRTTRSLAAAGQKVTVPRLSEQLDYEAELAVVIGRGGKDIAESDALSHVAGYALFNDITVRDYQWRGPQWTIGKNFDGTGILGPEIVTPDELPAGGAGLRIQTRINGETLQDGNTRDMIFDVAATIASLSETMTLDPGDVIATGTPAGVGAARKPPRWLRAGDICEVEIEGLGIQRTVIAAA